MKTIRDKINRMTETYVMYHEKFSVLFRFATISTSLKNKTETKFSTRSRANTF